jgi:hypothetical protein
MDGEMLADILRHRLPHNHEVKNLINEYDLFESKEELKTKKENIARNGQVLIEPPAIGENHEGKPVLRFSFDLPAGVTLTDFLQSCCQKSQMQLNAGGQHGCGFAAACG